MAIRKVCVAPGCDDMALPGLAHCDEHEAARQDKLAARRKAAKGSEVAQAGIALYRTKRWREAAKAHLRRHPLCRDCEELGALVEAREVDHIVPHRGDPAKFWDRGNWQGLCKSCHSRKTAGEVLHRAAKG
ncbi:HNH endonuclease [Yoonia vestfoldensis]|uniref:Putative HNH nuclease YajD n=1 Tax=Yoonia vestfoldensis TaxID=245188 RepID=A0A1Y0EI66_9RHOB|nr:HNH endonuclease signature motif containing protein [Yoonia vestfoldensis]ARU02982.1 HNH endonuclease [Yoonia vestfoldensis]